MGKTSWIGLLGSDIFDMDHLQKSFTGLKTNNGSAFGNTIL